MKRSKMTRLYRSPQMLLIWSAFVLIGACATVPDAEEWIKVGQTTKVEVVERYGQPDFVMASGEGETATYRPRDPRSPAPRMVIPTVQAGPLGSTTTKMEPINPGLGSRPTNGSMQKRPEQELRIRYNAEGIVQELIR
jgi:hypothetical protein